MVYIHPPTTALSQLDSYEFGTDTQGRNPRQCHSVAACGGLRSNPNLHPNPVAELQSEGLPPFFGLCLHLRRG